MTFNFEVANLSGIGSFDFQNSFGITGALLSSPVGIIGKILRTRGISGKNFSFT